MGVTIESKKGNLSIDMGYYGFFRLRAKVADLVDEDFSHRFYRAKDDNLEDFYQNVDGAVNNLILHKHVSPKVIDFLFQSDCDGKIHYGACKELLKVIGDYDDSIIYGYAGRADHAMFKDFKAILQECVDLKCDLIWW